MSIEKKNIIRSALLGSAATAVSLAALGVSAPAIAQDDEIEQVVVTGSRIPRADLVNNSPVAVVGAEEFQLTGLVSVERVLNTLPQVVPGLTNTSNNPGNGTATIDLRGLGTQRTLVLVNGRRFVPSSQGGVVDVNNIPGGLVERVEVVTGGASAVYGSDAMAGVVNFILKDDFEGFTVGSQFDISHKGDGESFNLNATMGTNFADGRGNVTVFAEYYNQQPIFQGDRDFTFFALTEGNTQLVPGGSSGTPQSTLFGFNDTYRFSDDGQTLGSLQNPEGLFNYAPFNYLQIPLERWNLSSSAHYQINDDIRFYMETNFINTRSPQELAPTPAFTTITLNVNNPFLTEQARDLLVSDWVAGVNSSAETPADMITADDVTDMTFFIGRRMLENFSRRSLDERNTWRVVVGFDGQFENGWTWDTYYSFGRVQRDNLLDGDVAASRFKQAVNTVVDDDGNPVCADPTGGCVPLNPFGIGNISDEAIDFVRVGAANISQIQQETISASIAGELIELPAGPLGFALGGEYRRDSSRFRPDEFLSSGDVLGFNAGLPTGGKFDVWEAYVEGRVPLISGQEWAEYAGLELGLRWSDYSTAGTVYSYKAGGEWQINSDLRLRGLFQRAVRAPSVLELFRGSSNGFPGAFDPCSASQNPSDAVKAFCVAQGVPAARIDTFEAANTQIQGLFSGNPNLSEEKSNTWTLGAVYQPESVPGLAFTVDYYDIEINDAINARGGGMQGTLDACFLLMDPSSEFCSAITRNTTSGQIIIADLTNANTSVLATEGLDVQIDYTIDLMEVADIDATLDLFWLGTYVFNNVIGPNILVPPKDCAGFFGPGCGTTIPGQGIPDLSWVSRATYTTGPVSLSLRWRYIDGLTDFSQSALIPTIGSENYFDVSFTWDMNDTLRLYGGVDNLFNNMPTPLGDSQVQSNTDPSLYDVIGTRIFVGATANF